MCIEQNLPKIDAFFNSNFVSSLLGAMAGAYGAYLISNRSKKKEELEIQIRNINTAIEIALGVLNSFISLKRITKPMCEMYFKDKESYELRLQSQQTETFVFKANLQQITVPAIPIETLKIQVFEKVFGAKGTIPLTAALIQSSQSLFDIHLKRNSWIDKFYIDQVGKGIPSGQEIPPAQYFGIRSNPYSLDTTYLSYMEGISINTDDCIFFCKRLCERLVAQAEKLNSEYKKKIKKTVEVSKPNFEAPDLDGMIPDPALYKEWSNI